MSVRRGQRRSRRTRCFYRYSQPRTLPAGRLACRSSHFMSDPFLSCANTAGKYQWPANSFAPIFSPPLILRAAELAPHCESSAAAVQDLDGPHRINNSKSCFSHDLRHEHRGSSDCVSRSGCGLISLFFRNGSVKIIASAMDANAIRPIGPSGNAHRSGH